MIHETTTKTLLLRPPERRGTSFAQFYTIHDSLGIGYLAAFLRSQRLQVETLDAHLDGLSLDSTVAEIARRDIQLLGVTIPSALLLPNALEIIRAVKEKHPELHVTVGGHHPTFFYEPMLRKHPEIDSVVRFEGEETLAELARHLCKKETWQAIDGIAFRDGDRVCATPPRPLIVDLDALPFPARDYLPKLIEMGGLPLISGSRGCPGKCTFCSVHCFYREPKGKIWRGRTPANILKEIEYLYQEFGCEELWFVDDNFLGPGTSGIGRIEELLSLLEKSHVNLTRMDFSCRTDAVVRHPEVIFETVRQRNGLIYPGVEAGVQRILDIYGKGTTVEENREAVKILKQAGAEIKMEFILFNPWITLEEIEETLVFLEEIGIYDPYILTSVLTIMKHTPMADAIGDGRLEILSPPHSELGSFDLDAFIPYRFADERVQTLFSITSTVIPQFEPALFAVHNLEQSINNIQKRLDSRPIISYEENIPNYYRIISETALDLFKEAVAFSQDMDLTTEQDQINACRETLRQKGHRFAAFLASVIINEEKTLTENVHDRPEQRGISG